MNQFVVSARKYRPASFDTVIGQSHITNTLKNAIKNNHLAQSFLFCGPRGVGKTTCARILAKTINCENKTENTEACNQCESCVSFNNNQSLNIYELDAASNNSVDDIRALVDQVRYAPQHGKYKIYIIDEVHMLSAGAFNAFLKTLEEPPSYAIFILATTEKHKIIPTILSRCQIFDFNRIKVDDIANHLLQIAKGEDVTAEPDALHIIAQKAEGALRDALSMFDQIVSFAGNTVTYKDVITNLNVLDYDYYFKVTDDIHNGNYQQILLTFDELLKDGFDGHNFINGLSAHFRDLLMCNDIVTLQLLEVTPSIREKYQAQAKLIDADLLLAAIDICNRCDIEYKAAKNQRLHVELTLLKMCRLKKKSDYELIWPSTDEAALFDIALNEMLQPRNISTGGGNLNQNQPEPVRAKAAENQFRDSDVSTAYVSKSGETKPAAKPVSTTNTSGGNYRFTPSIASLGSFKKSEPNYEVAEPEPVNKDSFTMDALYGFLDEYAEKCRANRKQNLAYTLLEHRPSLKDDFTIEFFVDSNLQEKDILETRADMLAFLREKLNNDFLKITTVIDPAKLEKMAYTPLEKFNEMANRYPELKDLKSKLDLDFGY